MATPHEDPPMVKHRRRKTTIVALGPRCEKSVTAVLSEQWHDGLSC